jgi:hypothetical protein
MPIVHPDDYDTLWRGVFKGVCLPESCHCPRVRQQRFALRRQDCQPWMREERAL